MQHPFSSCAQILHKGAFFDEKLIPERIQSFSQSLYNPDYGAYIHFYEEEKKCRAYKKGIGDCLNHLALFSGCVSMDYSIEWCAPASAQKQANYLNRDSFKKLCKRGISCIRNVRFGDMSSYSFCFRGIPQGGILFVGCHGTQRRADYKAVFIAGVCTLIEKKRPMILLVYGKVPQKLQDLCIEYDITLVRYPSQSEVAHKQ